MELSKKDKIIFISDLWGFADYKSAPFDTEVPVEGDKSVDVQSLHDHLKRQTISDFCDLIYHELAELGEKYNTFIVELLNLDRESESDMENVRHYNDRSFVKYDDVFKVCNAFIDKYAQTSNQAKRKLFDTNNYSHLVDLSAYMYVKMFYDMLNEIEPLTTVLENFDENIAAKLNG
jgi:hypothetical protein